jgi:hypothetical protein
MGMAGVVCSQVVIVSIVKQSEISVDTDCTMTSSPRSYFSALWWLRGFFTGYFTGLWVPNEFGIANQALAKPGRCRQTPIMWYLTTLIRCW